MIERVPSPNSHILWEKIFHLIFKYIFSPNIRTYINLDFESDSNFQFQCSNTSPSALFTATGVHIVFHLWQIAHFVWLSQFSQHFQRGSWWAHCPTFWWMYSKWFRRQRSKTDSPIWHSDWQVPWQHSHSKRQLFAVGLSQNMWTNWFVKRTKNVNGEKNRVFSIETVSIFIIFEGKNF